jgi:hypothetical protein
MMEVVEAPSFSLLGMMVLLVCLLFLLGLVATTIALLVNPKTRKATMISLLVGPLLLIALVALWRTASYRGAMVSAYLEPLGQLEPMSAVRSKTERNAIGTIATAAAATTPQAPQAPKAEAEDVKGEAAAAEKPAEAEVKKNDRPAWVDASPGLVDNAYEMAISIGPYESREECEAEVPAAIRQAVARFIEVCQDQPATGYAPRYDSNFCRQLIKSRWEEVTQHSIGPMRQLHLLLSFDQQNKQRILADLKRATVRQRLWYAGSGTVAILGVLGLLLVYLKLTQPAPSPQSPAPGPRFPTPDQQPPPCPTTT